VRGAASFTAHAIRGGPDILQLQTIAIGRPYRANCFTSSLDSGVLFEIDSLRTFKEESFPMRHATDDWPDYSHRRGSWKQISAS
jgi:hypothetical protein